MFDPGMFIYPTKFGIIAPFDINGDGVVDYRDVKIIQNLREAQLAENKVQFIPKIEGVHSSVGRASHF